MKKILVILVVSFIFLLGCTTQDTSSAPTLTDKVATLSDKSLPQLKSEILTFNELNLDVCTNSEGKPIVRLFATTWCPHCEWVKDTYANTVMEYVNAGFIEAYHWEVDIRDNYLTAQKETVIPSNEVSIFRTYNDAGSVPTFIFGCKYYRIGNGFESQNNLAAEEAEFRNVIEVLIKETQTN